MITADTRVIHGVPVRQDQRDPVGAGFAGTARYPPTLLLHHRLRRHRAQSCFPPLPPPPPPPSLSLALARAISLFSHRPIRFKVCFIVSHSLKVSPMTDESILFPPLDTPPSTSFSAFGVDDIMRNSTDVIIYRSRSSKVLCCGVIVSCSVKFHLIDETS